MKYASLMDRHIFQYNGWRLPERERRARGVFKNVERQVREQNGNPKTMKYLRQRIGREIQRGNAKFVMGTVDTVRERDEQFLIFEV